MSTRFTLRLAGLTAAIAVVLAITSTADAKPVSSSVYFGRFATAPADRPGDVGTPAPVQQAATGPADRPGDVGAPPVVIPASPAPVAVSSSSGFSWSAAALGALAAFAVSLLAMATLRSRRGSIALRA